MPQLQIFFVAVPINILCGLCHHAGAAGLDDHGLFELSTLAQMAVSSSKWRTIRDEVPGKQNSRQQKRLDQAREAGDIVKSAEDQRRWCPCWPAARWPLPMFGRSTAVGMAHVH